MRFLDLNVGDTFDFVSPDRTLNSFYERCVKLTARTYTEVEGEGLVIHRVGSINAKVYHVKRKGEQ